jgi:hypothetical protein
MGTPGEWLSVLVWGGLWGGTMAWWTERNGDAALTAEERIPHLTMWALAGLWFGIMTTFHWRAVHRPIVFVTVAALAGMVLVGRIFRKRRPGSDINRNA